MQLDALEPKEVLRWFSALAAIPHGSGNTKAVSDFCVAFAKERSLAYRRDALNNVIISAPAAPGYEDAPTVILQGHLDMVCAKTADCEKDMATEAIDLNTDGEWLWADKTSLGGDDGIAIAMALAVLDDPTLPRPRIEALFTVDEEIGMLGATYLDASPLQGKTVINIDSEAEGVFTVGCAGGVRTGICRKLPTAQTSGALYTLKLAGLTGGHSGAEIHKGRANAIVLTARVLQALGETAPLQLVSLQGGIADNVIPGDCTAEFAADEASARALLAAATGLEAMLRSDFSATDPGLRLTLTCEVGKTVSAVPADATHDFLVFLSSFPNGVQAMSREIPGLVETSLNFGIVSLSEGEARLCFLIRSVSVSEKQALADHLATLTADYGAEIGFSGDYPPWEYRADSPLRERMTTIYRRLYGSEPVIEAIHAGVECGILAGKIPDMDCVSIGPDILDIHTPEERLSIPSVGRVWTFLKEVLKESK